MVRIKREAILAGIGSEYRVVLYRFKYMKVLLTSAVPELSAREDQVENGTKVG